MLDPALDHLVLATPDLAAAVADLAGRTGVRAAPGGSHVGLGTANALIGLGAGRYLELVGPDPEQPEPDAPRPFGIDELAGTRLVTWAVRTTDLDAALAAARAAGHDPGPATGMSRRAVDGELLRWRLTAAQGTVPFLIDWGGTAHPMTRGLPALGLAEFTLTDPAPARLRARLAALGLDTPVESGDSPGLRAVLDSPRGPVVLTG